MLWSLFMIYLGGLIVGVLFFPSIEADCPGWLASLIAFAWPVIVIVYLVILIKVVTVRQRQVP